MGGHEKLCFGETVRDSLPFEPPPEEPASLMEDGPRQSPSASPYPYAAEPGQRLVWLRVSGFQTLERCHTFFILTFEGAPSQSELNLLLKRPLKHRQLQRHTLAPALDAIGTETGAIDF